MVKKQLQRLSKRERQIMDVFYMLGEATAAEVIEHMPEKVGDASIRKLIRIVEHKGYLTHRRKGHSYIYTPTISKEYASRQAMKHLLRTFFQDSVPKAVSTLIDVSGSEMTEEDIAQISELIRKAEEEGK